MVAACGPAGQGPTTGPTAGATSTGVSPSSSVAAGARLAAALGTLEAGYTFDTTLSVGSVVAAHVTGRRLGTSSELAIESGGATVRYRIIPPTAWLQNDGGDWAVATDPGSSADPLAPLLAPTSVRATTTAGGPDQLEATYPPAALGLQGTDPVTVTVSIAADGTVTVRFQTTVANQAGTSETVFHAAPVQDPIVAPSPLPSGA